MASIVQLAIIILCISIISVDARPCKTLFISSYSISLHRPQNPKYINSPSTSSGFVTIFTEITQFRRPVSSSSSEFYYPSVGNGDEAVEFEVQEQSERNPNYQQQQMHTVLPLGFSYDFTSLRDRTKDILSVVVALLFGVGCGALTAATMYLAYSVFANRFDSNSSFYEDGDEDQEVDDLKKMGYVKIPADSAPAEPKTVV